LHVRLSLSEITSLFGLSRYLDRTFAQRIGSAKVKSKSEVAHCIDASYGIWLLQILISLVGFIIGFGIYGPVSLYGVMAIEAAPTHLSGTSHAIASFACNSKHNLLFGRTVGD